MTSSNSNQLRPDLLGIISLNPYPGTVSASRGQMFGSHLSQRLTIAGATERYLQTGMEEEFGKATISVKMPVDARIIKVIQRHKKTFGADSIEVNPESLVIYEDDKTKEVGILHLQDYCTYHQYIGFQYKPTKYLNDLVPGKFIAKDTILLDSPAITEDGGYKYGIELNTALMSHPAVAEDGVLICTDVLEKLMFKTYETRNVEWGSKYFLLNIYGDDNAFKPFPEIGDYIREDGLLCALRSHDDSLAGVEQSLKNLRKIDHIFDKTIYVAGGGGRIVDIKITKSDNGTEKQPVTMEDMLKKYEVARHSYYREIIEEHRRLKKTQGEGLNITPEFHRLIVEALAYTDSGEKQRITKLYRKAPLDEYNVEFVIQYDVKPTIGYKLTNCFGGKGVIVATAEPHEMPFDADGNRADIIMDPVSVVNRMILGGPYELYYNAASRDLCKSIRTSFGIEKFDKKYYSKLIAVQNNDPELFSKLFRTLLGYYEILSPDMFHLYSEANQELQLQHFTSIMEQVFTTGKDGLFIYQPTDNEVDLITTVRNIEKYYKPTYGPVQYIGPSGQRVVTKNKVRIGSMYFMLLEKIGDTWSALSSGKLQHHGILSKINKGDRHLQPTRAQPVRGAGEAETRILASYVGKKAVAEIFDRNNNPTIQKEIVKNILNAVDPFNIPKLIDREAFKYGGAKPIQLVNHIAACQGWKFVYNKEKV